MALNKIISFSKKPTDLPDVPSPSYTALEIKEHFQTPSDEILAKHDANIDILTSKDGASNLGAVGFNGESTTIQGAIESLKSVNPNAEILASRTNASGKTFDNVPQRLGNIDTSLMDIATVNVKNYGAVGDGIVDDTQAFKDAIAAYKALSKPMGSIIVPSTGKWLLSDTVTIDVNGLIIKSENSETYSKIMCKTPNKTMFNVTSNGVKFLNVTFEGDMVTNDLDNHPPTVTAINFDRLTVADIDAEIIGCNFSLLKYAVKAKGRNININHNLFSEVVTGVSISNITAEQCRGFVIENNRFHNMGLGSNAHASLTDSICIEFTGDKTLTFGNVIKNNFADYGKKFLNTCTLSGFSIEDNYIYSYAKTVIECTLTTLVSNAMLWSISGNTITNSAVDYGIKIKNIMNGAIRNNNISKASIAGIYLNTALQNISVQNNTLIDCVIGIKTEYETGTPISWIISCNVIKDDTGLCTYGIYLYNCPNGIVISNTIRQTLKEGIYLYNSGSTIINNNSILNAGTEKTDNVYNYLYSAIAIVNSNSTTIYSNMVRSQQSPATNKYGIDVQNSSATLVRDNQIISFYTAKINFDTASINSTTLNWVQNSIATPTASAALRGSLIRFEGGAGAADSLFMCMKNSSDAYIWQRIL